MKKVNVKVPKKPKVSKKKVTTWTREEINSFNIGSVKRNLM